MLAIGCDLQSVAELRQKTSLLGNRAVLTEYERAYCDGKRDPWATLGGLLAAKEACVKALASCGSPPQLTFLDLEIRHELDGRPVLHPGVRLAPWLDHGALGIRVSISHSGDYAIATALVASHSVLT